MASTYLTALNGGKYAVLEPNFLAARRTGQVRAQLPLNATDFATKPAQNGTFLLYDMAGGSVREPGETTPEAIKGLMLHFSVEKEYDNVRPGLNTHAVWRQVANEYPGSPYPRLFQPHVGDTFTTDAVRFNGTLDAEALLAAYDALNPASAATTFAVDQNGFIDAATDRSATVTGLRVKLVKKTTLPDGGKACKFQVTTAV